MRKDLGSALELSVGPVSFLYLSCLDVDLLAPSVLLVVFPMAYVVVAIAVDLSAVPVSLLVMLALAFVNVAVWLGENQSADAFALSRRLVELAVDLRAELIHALAIAQGVI